MQLPDAVMKLDAITLREIRMPLVRAFETSFGRTAERRILLVTVEQDGLQGWGECTAGEDPYYCSESADTAWYVLTRYLGPALLDGELRSPGECEARFRRVRGHLMAKGALENALWDAEAQRRELPLWQLLGGCRRQIPCGVSIGIQRSIEELLDTVAQELAAGYRRIKIKVKPGWDLEPLARIRTRWPKIRLSCDANSAYTLSDCAHLQRFDEFQLLMLEQPLWDDDLYFHAQLQAQLQTAICLDECIHHARDVEIAAKLGAGRIVNLKLGRVGGFSGALAVHEASRRYGLANWCGGMLESGIGRAHNIALSTLENFTLPGDVSASQRYWKEDIIEPAVTVTSDGFIEVPDRPGRGFELRTGLIEKLTVRKETLRNRVVG
jgi:O-succinylbenzoate synthase